MLESLLLYPQMDIRYVVSYVGYSLTVFCTTGYGTLDFKVREMKLDPRRSIV